MYYFHDVKRSMLFRVQNLSLTSAGTLFSNGTLIGSTMTVGLHIQHILRTGGDQLEIYFEVEG